MRTYLIFPLLCITTFGSILPRPQVDHGNEAVLLARPIIQHSDVFQKALQLINTLETAPSCHRVATRSLLDSCQSLTTRKNRDSNLALDKIKSTFAARLALCELADAHASFPAECQTMTPKQSTWDSGFRCLLPGSNCERPTDQKGRPNLAFEDVTLTEIEECLKTLESRPQWWTSYSNARQNAVVMCHAARAEIEREELLETHKAMTKVSSDASQAIADASKRSAQNLESQAEFARRVQDLQGNVIKEMSTGKDDVRGAFRALGTHLETFLSEIVGRFSTSTSKAAEEMEGLNSVIRQSGEGALTVQETIKNTLETFLSQQNDISTAQQRDSKFAQENAVGLQNYLLAMRTQQLEPIDTALRDVRALIEAQMNLIQMMYEKQGSVDGRLDRLNDTIHSLQQRASAAENALITQEDARQQILQNMTSQMLTASGLATHLKEHMEDVERSIVNSRSLLDTIGPMNKIFTSWQGFTIMSTFLLYLLFGLEAARRVAIVEVVIYSASAIYSYLNNLQSYHIYNKAISTLTLLASHRYAGLAWIGLGGAVIVTAIARSRSRSGKRMAIQSNDKDIFSGLASTNKHGCTVPPVVAPYSV